MVNLGVVKEVQPSLGWSEQADSVILGFTRLFRRGMRVVVGRMLDVLRPGLGPLVNLRMWVVVFVGLRRLRVGKLGFDVGTLIFCLA